jgi:hypothetical protein
MHSLRCTLGGAFLEMQSLRCSLGDAVFAMHSLRCSLCGAAFATHSLRCSLLHLHLHPLVRHNPTRAADHRQMVTGRLVAGCRAEQTARPPPVPTYHRARGEARLIGRLVRRFPGGDDLRTVTDKSLPPELTVTSNEVRCMSLGEALPVTEGRAEGMACAQVACPCNDESLDGSVFAGLKRARFFCASSA